MRSRAPSKVNVVVKYRHAKRVMVTGRLVRLLNPKERREMAQHVTMVRQVRIESGDPVAPTKICRGCLNPFPRTLTFFHCRIRKGHKDYWNPYCRTCRYEKRDRERKAKAAT
jgi:hypothetical protein